MFVEVQPMLHTSAALPPPPPPIISTTARKSVARSLFGICPKGSVDKEITVQNELTNDYMKARYNVNLEELDTKCNQQISVTILRVKSQVEQTHEIALPNPRLEGIKSAFHVRKVHNGNLKRPKHKQSQKDKQQLQKQFAKELQNQLKKQFEKQLQKKATTTPTLNDKANDKEQ